MDNKITKERVGIHFEYDWIKYVAALILAIFLFALMYTMLAPRLKIYEEIKFLAFATPTPSTLDSDIYKPDSMYSYIQNGFNEKAAAEGLEESVVKSVTMEYSEPGSQAFPEWKTTRLISNFDFIIAPVEYFQYQEVAEDGKTLLTNEDGTPKMAKGELYDGIIRFSSVTDAYKDKVWTNADGTPCIDIDADDAGAKALGFYDAAQMQKARFFNLDGECVGFYLNDFTNIGKLFSAIQPETEDVVFKEYIIAVLQSGGNIGNLNTPLKKADKNTGSKDTSMYNESLDALKMFISRYSKEAI